MDTDYQSFTIPVSNATKKYLIRLSLRMRKTKNLRTLPQVKTSYLRKLSIEVPQRWKAPLHTLPSL